MLRGLLTILVASLMTGAAAAAERPNFLIVVTDDQRYDAVGVVQREQGEQARFPWFETPNMDRLAREGLRFRNSFVVCSLCSPSRAAMLTGRYNHGNGIIDNKTPLTEDAITYASLLGDAGYATGYVGKWHMGPQSGKRPGFSFSASFVGQGRYNDCPFEVDGQKTETSGWVDDVSTDYAIDFMRRQKDNPFLLIVGFKTPHGPRDAQAVPQRLASLYSDVRLEPAVSAQDRPPYPLKRDAAAGRGGRQAAGDGQRQGRQGRGPRAQRRQAASQPNAAGMLEHIRVYFQLLQGVDQNLGRLLDTLDELGVADNTVVIFTSDNGYFFGEHGLADKRAAYEDSLRVPLLVRLPGVEGGETRDTMTLNIDLAPTVLELAGVAAPESFQGRSLRPLLQGETPEDWRRAFWYEYFEEPPFETPTVFAARTEEAKLIRYPGHGDWTELYDLRADPHELNNLYGNPDHAELRQQMEAEFERQAAEAEFDLATDRAD